MDLRFFLLLICFFVSGFAALLYQTAWTREDLARRPWSARRQEVRGLERLAERLTERSRKERQAAESAAMDEIAVQRHQTRHEAQESR